MSGAVEVFVIALGDSDRVKVAESLLQVHGIDFQRVDAVDGRRMGIDRLRDLADVSAGLLLYGQELSPTQIGCALSHREAYRRFLMCGADWALVLEDDAFPSSLASEFVTSLTSWQPSSPTIIECFSAGRVNETSSFRRLGGHVSLQRLRTFPGFTVAYAINRHAAILALAHRGRVASRADWPQWAADVDFWRTRPNVFAHGVPDAVHASTMILGAGPEDIRRKGWRWVKLISGATYMRLKHHYPGGLSQYYKHAVLPSAAYWWRRAVRAPK